MTNAVGSLIRKHRKKEKLSGVELSKEVEITNVYLSQIETGRIKLPSLKLMIKLTRHLNIPFQKMLDVTGYSLEESVIEEETAKQKEIKKERAKIRAKEKRMNAKQLKGEPVKKDVIHKEKTTQDKGELATQEEKERVTYEGQEEKQANFNEEEITHPHQTELDVNSANKEEIGVAVPDTSLKKNLISMHPLDVLLSLETPILADLFLSHMRKGKIVYHTYLVHAMVKGADGKGSSREIIDLMIANHHELLHLDVFQSAIVRYAEQQEVHTTDPAVGAIKTSQDVEAQDFFPLWKKAYFSDHVLHDYGDYQLSSHKVDTFELEPLFQSSMVLLNGRIVNPNVVKTIRALLFETAHQQN